MFIILQDMGNGWWKKIAEGRTATNQYEHDIELNWGEDGTPFYSHISQQEE